MVEVTVMETKENIIHVDGNVAASGDGTAGGAFQTIPEALSAAAKSASPVTVALHAGVYNLTEPLEFGRELSDTKLTRFGSDNVTSRGGVSLQCEWKSYRDGILQV